MYGHGYVAGCQIISLLLGFNASNHTLHGELTRLRIRRSRHRAPQNRSFHCFRAVRDFHRVRQFRRVSGLGVDVGWLFSHNCSLLRVYFPFRNANGSIAPVNGLRGHVKFERSGGHCVECHFIRRVLACIHAVFAGIGHVLPGTVCVKILQFP